MSKIFNKFPKGHATGYLILFFLEAYEKLENILVCLNTQGKRSFRISDNAVR